MNGLHFVGIDPRPDDMTMRPLVFGMKHDGARLAGQAEILLGAVDVFEILLAGERPLRRIGIDGKAVEVVQRHRLWDILIGFDILQGNGSRQHAEFNRAHSSQGPIQPAGSS